MLQATFLNLIGTTKETRGCPVNEPIHFSIRGSVRASSYQLLRFPFSFFGGGGGGGGPKKERKKKAARGRLASGEKLSRGNSVKYEINEIRGIVCSSTELSGGGERKKEESEVHEARSCLLLRFRLA